MRVKLLLIGITALFAGYPVFADENTELAQVYYQSGLALVKQNKYEEAISKFNKALAYRRNSPEVLFKLGECYEKIKNPQKALQKYRLCLRYLQKKDNPSAESQQLLVQVTRLLDKSDTRGKKLLTTRNNYIATMIALAIDCINHRLEWVAKQILKQVLLVDPANKKAQDLLDKLADTLAGKDTPKLTYKTGAKRLFAGNDMGNWKAAVNNSGLRVEQGKLVANGIGSEVYMILDAPRPKNFVVTYTFTIDRPKGANDSPLRLINVKGDIGFATRSLDNARDFLKTNKLEYIVIEDKPYKVILNGKQIDETPPFPNPAIGLTVKNAKICFSDITLRELKDGE